MSKIITLDILKNDFFKLFYIYTLSYFLIILNFDVIYWDDWVVYNQSTEVLTKFFSQLNNSLHGYFYLWLKDYGNGILIFRTFLFFIMFANGIFVYLILKSTKLFDRDTLFYISLLYLLVPIFSAKISLAIIPFIMPTFLFYIAFYLLSIYIKKRNYFLRLFILFLFFCSFTTNSLLVFYALVLAYIFFIIYYTIGNSYYLKIKFFVFNYIDFILLPILFFSFKIIFLKPNGLYSSYNGISINIFLSLIIGFLIVYGIVFVLFKKGLFAEENKINIIYLCVAAVMFYLAVFPYIAVSKIPVIEGWNARFMLLTPLGISFGIYFSLKIFITYFKFSEKVFYRLLFGIIILFILRNNYYQYMMHQDGFYQTSIIENFRDSEIIKNNTTFVVINQVKDKLVYKRQLVYYEWTGMLKKAFNNDSKLMVPPSYQDKLITMDENQHHKQYNYSTWHYEKPVIINIKEKEPLSVALAIKLFYYKFKDYNEYKRIAKELTFIE